MEAGAHGPQASLLHLRVCLLGVRFFTIVLLAYRFDKFLII